MEPGLLQRLQTPLNTILVLYLGGLPIRIHLHPSADDPPQERNSAAERQEGLAGVGLQLAVRPLRQPLDSAAVRVAPFRNFGASHLSSSSGDISDREHISVVKSTGLCNYKLVNSVVFNIILKSQLCKTCIFVFTFTCLWWV